MDRLTKRTSYGTVEPPYQLVSQSEEDDWHKEVAEKLAYYEDLEEQWLLIKLPCKEGNIVYKEIVQHDNYDDSEYKIISAVCFRLDMLKSIGKTIFLTRDEAELKLKEMNK